MIIQFFHNHDIANHDSWLNSKLGSLKCRDHLYSLLLEMWNGAASVEKSLVVPQKVKHKLPSDPEIPLEVYIQENWKHMSTPKCVHECYSRMIYSSQKVEATQMSR